MLFVGRKQREGWGPGIFQRQAACQLLPLIGEPPGARAEACAWAGSAACVRDAHTLSWSCPSPSAKDQHPNGQRGQGGTRPSHVQCSLTKGNMTGTGDYYFPPEVLKTPLCLLALQFSLTLTGITGLKCHSAHHIFSPVSAHPWRGDGCLPVSNDRAGMATARLPDGSDLSGKRLITAVPLPRRSVGAV